MAALFPLAADLVYDSTQIIGPVCGVIAGTIAGGFSHRWRSRRKRGSDMTAMVEEHDETLYGRTATRAEPEPPPGIVDQVADIAKVQGQHTELLTELARKVTPNGGNTRQAGDLLLLIAEKLGIPIPDEAKPHGS